MFTKITYIITSNILLDVTLLLVIIYSGYVAYFYDKKWALNTLVIENL